MDPLDVSADCDWLAIDSLGQVGLFTTGGWPYLPAYYMTRTRMYCSMNETMRAMPSYTTHKLIIPREPGIRYMDWIEASEKGLFGYDYDFRTNSGYKLITTPEHPLRIIDDSIFRASEIPYFSGVFGLEAKTIDRLPVIDWMPYGREGN